ncbi:MAG TPA: hypothetical protein DCR93_20820, partial [Cytophagales bacterium]|nr:hypothetical protein [Cytophagales bacterium]
MKTKNPLVAALLSIVLPGAGLLYTGAAALGYLFILISIGLALSPHWVANSYSTIYLVGVIYLIWLATSAVLAAIRAKKSNSRGEISSNPWVILIVALVVDFGTYTWVTKPDFGPLKIVTMTNNSLSPLLYNREQLVVNTKVEIERGDLVGVYYPKPFFDLSVDVDRVIGYPGEVIELKNNLCYVNGNLTEPYENLRYTITISVATGTDIDFEFWNKYGLDGV